MSMEIFPRRKSERAYLNHNQSLLGIENEGLNNIELIRGPERAARLQYRGNAPGRVKDFHQWTWPDSALVSSQGSQCQTISEASGLATETPAERGQVKVD